MSDTKTNTPQQIEGKDDAGSVAKAKVPTSDVSNKTWIEYLAKNRDMYDKNSNEDLGSGSADSIEYQAQPTSDSASTSSPIVRKRTSIVGISSTPKLPSEISSVASKIGGSLDFDNYAKNVMENVSGPASPLKSPLRNAVGPSSNSMEQLQHSAIPSNASIHIRVVELATDFPIDMPDYKTISVHKDSTVLELLFMTLRKWRYLSPKFPLEFGPDGRPKLDDKHRNFIEREGWQFVRILKIEGTQPSPVNVDLGMRVDTIVSEKPPNNGEFHFGFKKMVENPILTDYHKSSLFHPCYVLKLESNYPTDSLQNGKEIEITHWAKRYLILAKNRYLLFFKSEHQCRWVQNVLHEIDFARVAAVERINVLVTDPSGLISTDHVLAKYSIRLLTRTRTIVLSCFTEQDRDRIVRQLNDVAHQCAVRAGKNSAKFNQVGIRENRTESSQSFDGAVSPMIRLINRIEMTGRLNDIDLPPFDFDPKTTEWLSWTISTNHSLFLTVKQLAYAKLKTMLPEQEMTDIDEVMGAGRDQIIGDAVRQQQDRIDGAGTFSTMKKFLKGLGTQQSQASMMSTDSSKGSSLFGVPLDELSQRYDISGIGIPVIPPMVRQCISHLREKGLNASGLFRIAGSVKRVEQLKRAFEKIDSAPGGDISTGTLPQAGDVKSTPEPGIINGNEIDYSIYNVHDVAGVLKMFFRDLPEPLMIGKLYRAFLDTDKLKSTEKQLRITQLLIMLLPPINRHLLEILMEFMHEVAKHADDKTLPSGEVVKGNLMNTSNLGVVMGPNILREAQKFDESSGKTNAPPSLTSSLSMPKPPSAAQAQHSRNHSASVAYVANETGEDGGSASAAQELTDSTSVVNVTKFMIENYRQLFTIPPEFQEEMRKLVSFTASPVHQPRLKVPTA